MSQRNREKQKQKRKEYARKRAIKGHEQTQHTNFCLMSKMMGKIIINNASEEVALLVENQRRLFLEKFGREATEGDPLWFQPDKDVPTEVNGHCMTDNLIRVSELMGLPKDVVYAMKKTKLLVYGQKRHLFSSTELFVWDAAITEYHHSNKSTEQTKTTDDDWLKVLKN